MVDSIGRKPIGKVKITGKSRRNVVEKVKKKMEVWRDKARLNILHQRDRYKQKVSMNEALMKKRKSDRKKNLNPVAFSTLHEQKSRPSFNYSTISRKPKYSDVKPRERIYGRRFELIEQERRKRKQEMAKKK